MLEFVVVSAMAVPSEAQCYSKLSQDTKFSEERITLILANCAVKMLEGEKYLLNPGMHKLRLKLYPREAVELGSDTNVPDMSTLEKADRILTYNECKMITKLVNEYIKQCRSK